MLALVVKEKRSRNRGTLWIMIEIMARGFPPIFIFYPVSDMYQDIAWHPQSHFSYQKKMISIVLSGKSYLYSLHTPLNESGGLMFLSLKSRLWIFEMVWVLSKKISFFLFVFRNINSSITLSAKIKHPRYREPETWLKRQPFGCLDTWPYSCKQIPSLRSPITYVCTERIFAWPHFVYNKTFLNKLS